MYSASSSKRRTEDCSLVGPSSSRTMLGPSKKKSLSGVNKGMFNSLLKASRCFWDNSKGVTILRMNVLIRLALNKTVCFCLIILGNFCNRTFRTTLVYLWQSRSQNYWTDVNDTTRFGVSKFQRGTIKQKKHSICTGRWAPKSFQSPSEVNYLHAAMQVNPSCLPAYFNVNEKSGGTPR